MANTEIVRYPIDQLREFATRIFAHCGVPESDANLAADVLTTADLWGIDTHGVARLKNYYEMLIFGHANPRPEIKLIRESPSTANLDGDRGLGLVIGPKVNEIAMSKAEDIGSAWVSVCNSTHFGIAGYYPYMALPRDLIGWAMTNTTPQVAPLWGRERMLGTNPIAIAFPGYREPPIVIDMATSSISYGKVENAIRMGESLPAGCITDREGAIAVRPEEMINGGAILPLGGDRERGGHKGYCLSVMVDLLSGVLSGANWGPFVPPFPYNLEAPGRKVGKGIGHFFGAFRIDGFLDPLEFKCRIDEWIRVFRTATPAKDTNGPLIPGDPERKMQALQLEHGVELLPSVIEELRRLSARAGICFD
jgi:LDH2 family malate/lactate/ureidoglycolate dehydrogenase